MGSKYIPPERMTAEQLRAEIDERFRRWDEIYKNGCQDPFWADGVNLNLVRNHIIYYSRFLQEKLENVQLSLFPVDVVLDRPLPPELPDNYMAPGGAYKDRLKWRETT